MSKTALITGSSNGIGKEIALAMAKNGFELVLTYNSGKKEAEQVAAECRKSGNEVLVLHLDITDNKSIKECVRKTVEKFKKIDILVNNAGVISWKRLKEQSFEEIEAQVRTNLEGLIKMTYECLPYVKEMVINVASGAGKTAYGGLSTYCATKFGVRGFTQAIAQEYFKLKVYSLNPTTTATRMTNFEGTSPEKVAEIALKVAKGEYKLKSGSDVDVWDLV